MSKKSHPVLPPQTIPNQAPGYTLEKTPCCFFLKNTETEKLTKLNQTGALIWQICTGEWSVGEIIDVLKESYPDAADGMENDVYRTMDLLLEQNLIDLS